MGWADCFFRLNGQAMGELEVRLPNQILKIPAYSGARPFSNQRTHMCIPHVGAIPLGEYYVVDRESGGRLGWLKDLFNEKTEWFSLYRIDDKIDDYTWCDGVKRVHFRIHYSVSGDGSRGCVTLANPNDFRDLKSALRTSGKRKVSNLDIECYGKLTVL